MYDHDITVFINELEERVKSAIMSLYAKPSGAGDECAVSSVAKREDEDDVSYARRLQEALQASESELAEVRSRNAVLAEQILGVAPTSANASDDPSAVAKNGARHASAEALHAAVEAAKAEAEAVPDFATAAAAAMLTDVEAKEEAEEDEDKEDEEDEEDAADEGEGDDAAGDDGVAADEEMEDAEGGDE